MTVERRKWPLQTAPATAHLRAGGRRRYNAWRQLRAAYRRAEILRLAVEKYGVFPGFGIPAKAARMGVSLPIERGIASKIARDLGVHRSTVCRDCKQILRGLVRGELPGLINLLPQINAELDRLKQQNTVSSEYRNTVLPSNFRLKNCLLVEP